MLTDEIEQYISQAGGIVCAADQLPQVKLKKPTLFISNTEERDKKGAHWVLLGKPNENELIYFDSLCTPPLTKYYYNFLQHNSAGTTFKTNKFPIQSESTSLCGMYTVLLFWHLRTGRPFETFCAQFGASVAQNDLKLERLWKIFTRR
jgi:hypothetical protein